MKSRTAPTPKTKNSSATKAAPASGSSSAVVAEESRSTAAAPAETSSRDAAIPASLLLNTLIAFKEGDFTVRMPVDQTGIAGKVNDTLNEIFRLNARAAAEFARIASAVGKEGKINQRASIGTVSGGWADCIESVNSLIGDLVQPS